MFPKHLENSKLGKSNTMTLLNKYFVNNSYIRGISDFFATSMSLKKNGIETELQISIKTFKMKNLFCF